MRGTFRTLQQQSLLGNSTAAGESVIDDAALTFIVFTTLGVLACSALLMLACISKESRNSHTAKIILIVSVCDLIFAFKYWVTTVLWVAGYRTPGMSFRLIDDGCASSASIEHFVGSASNLWNAAFAVDFLSVLWNPLRSTRSQMVWYHILIWPGVIATTVFVLASPIGLESDPDLCFLLSPGNIIDLLLVYPVYVGWVFGFASLAFALFRLLFQGTRAARFARCRLFGRHLLYSVIFMMTWFWLILALSGQLVTYESQVMLTKLEAVFGGGGGFFLSALRLVELWWLGAIARAVRSTPLLRCASCSCRSADGHKPGSKTESASTHMAEKQASLTTPLLSSSTSTAFPPAPLPDVQPAVSPWSAVVVTPLRAKRESKILIKACSTATSYDWQFMPDLWEGRVGREGSILPTHGSSSSGSSQTRYQHRSGSSLRSASRLLADREGGTSTTSFGAATSTSNLGASSTKTRSAFTPSVGSLSLDRTGGMGLNMTGLTSIGEERAVAASAITHIESDTPTTEAAAPAAVWDLSTALRAEAAMCLLSALCQGILLAAGPDIYDATRRMQLDGGISNLALPVGAGSLLRPEASTHSLLGSTGETSLRGTHADRGSATHEPEGAFHAPLAHSTTANATSLATPAGGKQPKGVKAWRRHNTSKRYDVFVVENINISEYLRNVVQELRRVDRAARMIDAGDLATRIAASAGEAGNVPALEQARARPSLVPHTPLPVLNSSSSSSGGNGDVVHVPVHASGLIDRARLTCFGESTFAQLRRAAGLSSHHIVTVLDPILLRHGYLKAHFSDGASASFFCKSVDSSLIVKTIAAAEVEALLRMLPDYAAYVLEYPDTLLCRFYACFALTMPSLPTLYFVLMGNAFPIADAGRSSLMYDLKGSWVGRRAKPSTSSVLLDQDFAAQFPRGLSVQCHDVTQSWDGEVRTSFASVASTTRTTTMSDAITRQLAADSRFLQAHGVMDYSLVALMSPVDVSRERLDMGASLQPLRVPVSREVTETGLEREMTNEFLVLTGDQLLANSYQGSSGGENAGDASSNTSSSFRLVMSMRQQEVLSQADARTLVAAAQSVASTRGRGFGQWSPLSVQLLTRNASGALDQRQAYLAQIGVIDMLQTFTCGKLSERVAKTAMRALRTGSLSAWNTISSVDPPAYQARFGRMTHTVFKQEDSEAQIEME